MAEPVVLCGLGKIGSRVFDRLQTAGIPVVAIDRARPVGDPRLTDANLIVGDMRDPNVLTTAGIATAHGVMIVTSDDLVNIATALAIRRLNPNIRIVVRVFNPNLLARLGSAVGNVHALSVSALSAPMLAYSAMTGEVFGGFESRGKRFQVAKLVVADDSDLVGRPIESVARQFDVLPLGHRDQSGVERLLSEVAPDAILQANDELIACGSSEDLERLLPIGQHDLSSLSGVRWAGRIRRFGRVALRAVREIDIALRICAAVLFLVVAASTVIYAASGMADSIPDGLYRTISVMATGADMKADQYVGWQKTFVSFLRVFGAVLVASFTAIVTNYMLRARLGGVFEVRRIPEAGHFVVCGLGNVGFRVVDELLRADERVVVIERKADNPRIGTCRRLGAAVIVAEATMLEVLRQAQAATSRAVIAATHDDLANLEIALLARELHPHQRVVVRLNDDRLAETLQQVADVRLALALPGLAAPAFIAALYGDRVHSLFRIHQRMLAAVDVSIQPNDPILDGQCLGAVAIDYGLSPIGAGDLNRRLKAGETITVIARLRDLERLFRREPAPAEWQIEIVNTPSITREQVELLIRLEAGLSESETTAAFGQLPFKFKKPMSRGQAEQFLARLEREKVEAKIVHV